MKKLRVLVLTHVDLVPPDSMEGRTQEEIDAWKSEFDVVTTLREMGHTAEPLGVLDDLKPIRDQILEFRPHVAFNMLEEFHQVVTYDQAIVNYLELMRQRYTGCNPRGLMITHDKALSKKILAYHRIPTPRFAVFPIGRKVARPKRLDFPLFVKSVVDDGSAGIAQASIVRDDDALIERVRFVHETVKSDALVEQYIEGRELYVGVIGNRRLQTFPVWELIFDSLPDDMAPIATAKAKWDHSYQKRVGLRTAAADDLSPELVRRIAQLCKRVYRALHISGYARMDLRLRNDGRMFVLEANANPDLSYGEDFAESAESAGISYEQLLWRIISLGMRYDAPWKGV